MQKTSKQDVIKTSKLQKRKGIVEEKRKEEVQNKKGKTEKISCINPDNDFKHVDLNEEINKDFAIPGKPHGINKALLL